MAKTGPKPGPRPYNYKEFCPKGHRRIEHGSGKHCYQCDRARYKKKYQMDQNFKKALNARSKKWIEDNRDRYRIMARDYAFKRQGRANLDGTQFSMNDYNRHFQIQGGMCKGCGRHQSELKRTLVADHDHKTGFFRALLCDNCNKALGHCEDNRSTLLNLLRIISHAE